MISDANSIALVHPHCDRNHTEKANGIKYLYASLDKHPDVSTVGFLYKIIALFHG